MAVSVSSIVAAAVKDINVAITAITGVGTVLGIAGEIPFIPAPDQHWVAGAIVFTGLLVKVLKDVVADLASA
jgi:energy-converting hydrogenase Eha subunit G